MEIAEQQQPRVGTVRRGTSRISQVVTLVAVIAPPLGILLAMGLLWEIAFHWIDVVVLVVAYTVCAFGTTIGFHRYFSHRSFQARAPVKAALAILGCMTVQGPLTQWVTDHRKHHAFSDKEGDPHSPHAGHPETAWGAFTGFVHAHVGWMFSNMGMEQGREYGKDLYEDRLIRVVDRLYLLWVVLTLGIPFAIGYVVGGVGGRRRGARLGRPDPHLPVPARDLRGELDLPHVRAPGLPCPRRVAEQLVRRVPRLRRGLAQQPPRVPVLGAARPGLVAVRRVLVDHPRPREAGARLGREAADCRQMRRRRRADSRPR